MLPLLSKIVSLHISLTRFWRLKVKIFELRFSSFFKGIFRQTVKNNKRRLG